MKNILLVCTYANIDPPLRRSLAHLVNSCYIEIMAGGHQTLELLNTKTFDLIIIDSALADIDCLELIESIDYLDPGLPIILMLRQEHRLLWGPAQNLGVYPIYRPFKPLSFLRLVDTLLHEQLERYRELAKTLELALTTLSSQIQAAITFLIDGTGSILLSTTQTDDSLLNTLAQLVIVHFNGTSDLAPEDEALLAPQAREADRELYGLMITENLYLAALRPLGLAQPLIPVWLQLEVTAYAIKEAFIEYELIGAALEDLAISSTTDEDSSLNRLVLHLNLEANLTPPPPASPEVGEETAFPEVNEEENLSVNWQIISHDSAILSRLQNFCQIN